ncbi:MAG TPA: NepR family anti-sigma factor [Dongiaceae bacterium]|nr:NepR family anti-sigma factor [Dongiaceae bacterium]
MSSKPKDQNVGTQNKVAAGGDRPPKQPRGVDRWFDEEINKLYVDVVNEPLPDDLARLVSQLKARKAT